MNFKSTKGSKGKNFCSKNSVRKKRRLSWSKITTKKFLYPNLATVHNVGVDGEVRIDQAHLVFKLLGHALSGSGRNGGWETESFVF